MPAIQGVKRWNRDCGSVAPSRTAAIGGTRVARIAGKSPARSVMPIPTTSETTTVRVAKTRSAVGKSTPRLLNSAWIPSARSTPRAEPDERGEQPDDERLEDHGAEHLPPRRADRPQRRELPRPLGDRDREVLKMTNAPTKSAIAGEREQEVAEDRRELAHVVRLLLRLRRRAHDLRVLRQDRLDRRDELVLGDPLARGDGDRVVLALAAEELLRGGEREHGEADAAEALEIAVLRDADERERALRLQRGDLDRVADGPALLVHGAGVDDHLVGGRAATAPRGA